MAANGGVIIRDNDHGYQALVRKLNGALGKGHGALCAVGVDDRPHTPTGVPTDEIAAVHEFGLGNAPARSFLRGWVDENRAEIEFRLANAGVNILQRGVPEGAAMAQFGAWAVDEVRKRIWAQIPPPLQAATVKRKGSATPLIDSGQLVNAILAELYGVSGVADGAVVGA